MNKRSGKFYRRNEEEVMRALGLKPTKNSGSGWIEKEDGQSENVICQLKSTDANSIRIYKQDIDTLNHNALVSHKIPVFAIQFIASGEVYLLFKPESLQEVAEYIETGNTNNISYDFLELSDEHPGDDNSKCKSFKPRKTIKSSSSARENFKKEQDKKFEKKRRSAT